MEESVTFDTGAVVDQGLSTEIIGLLQPAATGEAIVECVADSETVATIQVPEESTSVITVQNTETDPDTEQYQFNGDYIERDGQLYMILQNSRGETFEMHCEGTNIVTIPEQVLTADTTSVDAIQEIAIDLPIVTENQTANDTTKLPPVEEETPNELVPCPKKTATVLQPSKPEPVVKLNSTTIKPEIANNKQPISSSSNSTTVSKEKPSGKTPIKNAHFANNHSIGPTQLANSQKTYSRTSNIVWLNLPDKKESNHTKKLTTTIELAEPDNSVSIHPAPIRFNEITTSSKVNRIANFNSSPKSINVMPKMPEKVTFTMNSPNKKDELISIKYSTNKTESSPVLLNELKAKKKVTFQENKHPDGNDSKTQADTESDNRIDYPTPPKFTPATEMVDYREKFNNCDYKVNDLVVSVRIQPTIFEQSDTSGPNLICGKCGLETKYLNFYKIHESTCTSKYFRPAKPPSLSSWAINIISNRKPCMDRRKRKFSNDDSSDEDGGDHLNKVSSTDDVEMKEELATESEKEKSDIMDDLNQEEEEEDEEDTKTLDGYSTKDVVWVETKIGYWPALIMDINDKKLFLRLIDCPIKKESLKTFPKSVVSFNKPSVDKYLKENKTHNSQLLKTVQKVEDYLRKRCLGSDVNPVKFFNFPEFFESTANENPVPSDVSKTGDGTENNPTKSSTIDGTEILKYIKDGNIEAHLRGIYVGNNNERHKRFFENETTKSDEKIGFGPIKDEDQQDDLFSYCSKLYESIRLRCNGKDEEKFDLASYIYNVWIPEAIIKAISKKKRVDMKKAEELFNLECSDENHQLRD